MSQETSCMSDSIAFSSDWMSKSPGNVEVRGGRAPSWVRQTWVDVRRVSLSCHRRCGCVAAFTKSPSMLFQVSRCDAACSQVVSFVKSWVLVVRSCRGSCLGRLPNVNKSKKTQAFHNIGICGGLKSSVYGLKREHAETLSSKGICFCERPSL